MNNRHSDFRDADRAAAECEPRVVDDPDEPMLPIGCIHADELISLAHAVEKLERWHFDQGGAPEDRPCLRRLENANGTTTAHISSGRVLGSWDRLELVKGIWVMSCE